MIAGNDAIAAIHFILNASRCTEDEENRGRSSREREKVKRTERGGIGEWLGLRF
jgi:hypothetical protein